MIHINTFTTSEPAPSLMFPPLTSLSRVRERPLMGAGLAEAVRTGGCGEEEEEDEEQVKMGGETEEKRVGG